MFTFDATEVNERPKVDGLILISANRTCSSSSTVLLKPPIFSKQSSKYTSSVSLQNIPQSAIVLPLK